MQFTHPILGLKIMKLFMVQAPIFSLMLFSSIHNAQSADFKGSCLLNQSSPDYTLAGSEIINAKADVIFKDDIFTASYMDSEGKKKKIVSPKLNIKLDDGVMALYGPQWMAKNNNTFLVVSNSRRIVIDNCAPKP